MTDPTDMARHAGALEARARELLAEARELYRESAQAGSLEGAHALVRLAVADGDYEVAHVLLRDAESRHAGGPPRALISVAPDVLGRGISLDGDDADDAPGAGTFTVVTPYAERAAAVLTRVGPELLTVDEHGGIQRPPAEWPPGFEPPYTPNFLHEIEWCSYAAAVALDTKGVMWSAMGRTMVGMLVDALAAEAIPAHITGERLDLRSEYFVWEG